MDFKGDFYRALSLMRLDRFLGNMQVVLWKPRYLIKNYVTEWGTAVKKLRRRSETQQWMKEREDIQPRFAPVVSCGGYRRM